MKRIELVEILRDLTASRLRGALIFSLYPTWIYSTTIPSLMLVFFQQKNGIGMVVIVGTAFPLLLVVGSLLGPICDKIGPKKVIVYSTFTNVVCMGAYPFSYTNKGVFLAIVCAQGVSFGVMFVAGGALLVQQLPIDINTRQERRGLINSLAYIVQSLAAFSAPPVVEVTPTYWSLLHVPAGVMMAWYARRLPSINKKERQKGVKIHVKLKLYVMGMLATVCFVVVSATTMNFTLIPVWGGTLLAANGMFSGLTGYPLARLASCWGHTRVLKISSVVLAFIPVMVLACRDNIVLIGVSAFFLGVATRGVGITFLPLMEETVRKDNIPLPGGSLNMVDITCAAAGKMLGPLYGGLLISGGGGGGAWLWSAAAIPLVFASLMLYIWARRTYE